MTELTTITGQAPADLSNAVSAVIHAAIKKGMPVDEAVCVALSVAVDYGRIEYGDRYCKDLADVVLANMGQPLPRAG